MIRYDITDDTLFILQDGECVLSATKDYQLIDIAKNALCGKLTIPAFPEPIEITDHQWLLRLAGDVSHQAALSLGG